MTFMYPLLLLLLAVVPLLALGALLWQRRATLRMVRLSRYAKPPSRRFYIQLTLLLLGLACLIVGLAGPRWGRTHEEHHVRSRNVMLAVDVSRSMLASDVHPNRLGRAKADLIDLVDVLQGDRAGLLAFRGQGVLLCPMTTDRAYLRQTIDALEPDSAPPGETDLADAIAKCLTIFERAESQHNAIVLVSDGEDLAGEAETLAKEAGTRNIPIFTVGIGSTAGASIPDGASFLQHEGQTVRTQLTEATLRAIADASGGRYIPLATAGTARTTLGAVYTRYLAQLADQEHKEHFETAFTDRTGIFVFVATLLLLGAASCSLGRIAMVGMLVICAGGRTFAQADARDAQRAYRAGDYEAAAEAYATARTQAEPSEAAHYAYNEALALWKANHITNALERVRLAEGQRAFAARANTLEGTLLMQMATAEEDLEKRLEHREAAVAAFTRALQAEPSDRAERNLARAQTEMAVLRQDVRKAKALARYKETPFPQLVTEMLTKQRALIASAPEVFDLRQPSLRLKQSEQLAKDVREQADRWYSVIETLPSVVQDEQVRADLLARATTTQATLDALAATYEELGEETAPLMGEEAFVYDLWKAVADPVGLNQEAIFLQERSLKGESRYQVARDDQEEVLALLQQFRLIFPEWAKQKLEQQAQQAQQAPAEGAPASEEASFTQADVDIINQTADATVPMLSPPVREEMKQKALENLQLIREHLPKDSNQSQQNAQKNPQQQQQNQQQQQQQDASESESSEAQESEAQEESSDAKEEDLEALLQKAVDREQAHEDEKRRLRPKLPQNTRDW